MTTTSKTTKTAADAAQTYFSAMFPGPQGFETASKAYEDFMAMAQDNAEAFMAAGAAAAKGVEAINAELIALNKAAIDDAVATAKALTSVKTLQDAAELQSMSMQNAINSYMTQATKLSELAVKASQAAMQPLNERFSTMVEKTMKPVSL